MTPLGSLRLWRSKSRLPPTFPVGTSTLKLIDSTAAHFLMLVLRIIFVGTCAVYTCISDVSEKVK